VTAGGPDPDALGGAVAWFAPGLVGFGLFSLLSRALYARGLARLAALGAALGWASVALAGAISAGVVPAADRIVALAASHSIGTTVMGIALLVSVRRRCGRACLAGVGRGAFAALTAAAVAGVLGALVARAVAGATPTFGESWLAGMLAGVVVAVVFAGVAYALDRRQTGALVAGLARQVSRTRTARPDETEGAT
jgi:putative peptidoglycan lipid II flippase